MYSSGHALFEWRWYIHSPFNIYEAYMAMDYSEDLFSIVHWRLTHRMEYWFFKIQVHRYIGTGVYGTQLHHSVVAVSDAALCRGSPDQGWQNERWSSRHSPATSVCASDKHTQALNKQNKHPAREIQLNQDMSLCRFMLLWQMFRQWPAHWLTMKYSCFLCSSVHRCQDGWQWK